MMALWYSATMLGIEANQVVGLRLLKLSGGGLDARDEAALMVYEKMWAAIEAGTTLAFGGPLGAVVGRYREHVGANTVRLLTT